MYYGAISTDIRKSSTNWNLFPEWMQKAVNYTNNITEFVFNDCNLFNGIILPNSPEGDAYTFYYRHENKDDLIKVNILPSFPLLLLENKSDYIGLKRIKIV